MKSCKSKVMKHLKGDSKTWDKLSKEAKSEGKSDKKLIKTLKNKK
jgi:hypothetical protein